MNEENRAPANWESLKHVFGLEQEMWNRRLVCLAEFLTEKDLSVVDFGAGAMHLENILPSGVKYIPVDYVARCDKTFVCDFNKGEFPDILADVAFCAGILEYIKNPDWFIENLCSHYRKIILSYKGREQFPEQQLYTQKIIDKFASCGFMMTGRSYYLADTWSLLACFEKAEPELLGSNVDCTGCGACRNVCPSDAIFLHHDKTGFLKPSVDSGRCIGCRKCLEVCPVMAIGAAPSVLASPAKNFMEPSCFAAWGPYDVRVKSSSGGVFSTVAKLIISEGGFVFGARWDEDFNCVIEGTNCLENIQPFCHSKYVQANTELSFREVRELVESGILVGYFGTPCQIAGLRSYLGELQYRNNLMFFDLVCFCAPSNEVFKKYLDENWGRSHVKDVVFRDKKYGWSPTGFRVDLKDGTSVYPRFEDDLYQQIFHGVLARNEVCEHCHFAHFPRQGDFTIGDFWGIDFHDASWNDGSGTSLVLVNNKKADDFFLKLKDEFARSKKVPLEWALNKGNRIIGQGRERNYRWAYLNKLLETKSFNIAAYNAIHGIHDIGLVCLCNHNIGNNMTNYALYAYLSACGYSVLLIDKWDDNSFCKYDDKFSRFLKTPYPSYDVASGYRTKNDMEKLNTLVSGFVLGSDQLLRSGFIEGMEFHPLCDWVHSYKWKIAYATSFGVDTFEGSIELKKKVSFLLKRFCAVSVREKSGVRLCRELGVEAKHVLDPVFLCNMKNYDLMAQYGGIRLPQKPFTFAYVLDPTEEREDLLHAVAEHKTSGVVRAIIDDDEKPDRIQLWNIDTLCCAKDEEWLSHIKNCDFFVTDSFHGICFALIFKKQFCVIYNKWQWRGLARIRDILELFGLQERLVEDLEELKARDFFDTAIDYTKVYAILDAERKSSSAWLESCIQNSFEKSYDYDIYDYVSESSANLRLELEQKSEQITLLQEQLNTLVGTYNRVRETFAYKFLLRAYNLKEALKRRFFK